MLSIKRPLLRLPIRKGLLSTQTINFVSSRNIHAKNLSEQTITLLIPVIIRNLFSKRCGRRLGVETFGEEK